MAKGQQNKGFCNIFNLKNQLVEQIATKICIFHTICQQKEAKGMPNYTICQILQNI